MTPISRRNFLFGTAAATVLAGMGLSACASPSSTDTASASKTASPTSDKLNLDTAAWKYDSTNDVYYQLGIAYVASPQAPDLETLGIYVPGAYVSAKDNGNGTFTLTRKDSGKVGSYTAADAPIVFPVNTPGYAGQQPPTTYSYSSVSSFMKAGLVYVHAGLRGKDTNADSYKGNAPWGVTDLKAAVRYIRYNIDVLPGSTKRIAVFGHSGGGAQSSIMGASGDSELYTPYLDAIGAASADKDGKALSDAVAGVMAWCPITSLDYADSAYEWNMGQFASSGTRADGTWTAAYSDDLAKQFAEHINKLGLTDGSDGKLTLEKSDDGVYLSGSYYDHVVDTITDSLNTFLANTTFPYTPSSSEQSGMDPSGGGAPSGGGTPPSGGGSAPSGGGSAPSGGQSSTSSTTYDTVADYFTALNADGTWVTYDSSTKKAKVTSLSGFVKSQKPATKDVGAFDAPDRSATENVVFGDGTDGLHFGTDTAAVIKDNESAYAKLTNWKDEYGTSAYTEDASHADSVGKDMAYRSEMYNPMYFLSDYYDGADSSTVAPHWRIRTGITQGDTASTVEINLALALADHGVKDVDFATVWGQGHTMAEVSGDGTTNFIAWVEKNLT